MKSPFLDESSESGQQERPSPEPERIEVRVGEQFTLTRSQRASTGYSWELDDRWRRSGVVTLARHDVEPGDLERPGSAGRELWTFRAEAPGQVTLRLTRARSWEPDSASTDEVLVTVR